MNMNDKEFDMLFDEIKEMEFAEPVAAIVNDSPAAATPTPTKKKSKSKSAINDSELENMLADIKTAFPDAPFKNKDLAEFLDSWGLSSRQTPSRLKKLVEAGVLEDLGGSPKSYKLV